MIFPSNIKFYFIVLISPFLIVGQNPDPLLVEENYDKQEKWVDSIYNTLTLNE